MDRLRRHPWLGIGGFLLLVLLLLAAAAVARAFALRGDAATAMGHLEAAAATVEADGFELTADDAQQVGDEIARADTSLARVAAALEGDPVIVIVHWIPGLGGQVDHAATLVRAARLITSRHTDLQALMDDYVAAQAEGQGPERLAALARFVAHNEGRTHDLLAAFDEADRLVEATPTADLVGPLAQVRELMEKQIERARPLVAAWELAQDVVPSVFGVGGTKRYIVLALDNAEIRPVGGLIATFATPTFRDGLLEDFTFRDVLDIDLTDQAQYVQPPPGLAGHLLGDLPWQVADAGWWPDFQRSAAEVRRLYRIETGEGNLDGTIAFTPDLVDALLKIVGPVTIPDAGVTVHPGETYLISLEQAEILNRGPGRKQFLAELASEVLKRLLALPPSRYPEVVAALDEAGKRRQLQIFLDDAVPQAAIEQLGWYTSFVFPAGGDRLAVMEANVAPVSKLDVLLDLDHSLDVRLTPEGNAQEDLVTTYTNRFGPDLPPALQAVSQAFRSGDLGSYERRYLVPGATNISVSSDGAPPLTGPERIEQDSESLSVASYQLIRPGATHLETSYLAPRVVDSTDPSRQGTYRLSFFKQPGRDHDTLTVTVSVPEGTHPIGWSTGGSVLGRRVTFHTTTEFDRTFEVRYAAD